MILDFEAPKQSSNVPGFSVPKPVETADSRGEEHDQGWEEAPQEQETDFNAPMPAPEGVEQLQAERAEAAAKEKEQKDREAREEKEQKDREAREKKAKEKKEREAKEKAERLAQEKADQQAKDKAKKEAVERHQEEQRRAAEKSGLPPGAKLEICLDNGWQPLGEEEFKQIQNHLSGGEAKFAIQARGAMYVVDFTDPNNPTQGNAMSGKTRKLRVVK